VARPEKTEPLPVCVDADVLIAGLLSRTGASHAILVLGELGLLRLVLPEAAVAEVRRNLAAKLPDVTILAAAIGGGARILVTHNIRHFRSGEGVRVVRPRTLLEEARAWMASFGA
jgi:hypothetical protein